MSRSRSLVLALAATLALALSACAGRPGADTLTPVAPLSGLKTVTVYVATTRTAAPGAPTVYTEGRAPDVSYARYVISIPPAHKPAEIEWPAGEPDPSKTFAVLSSSALSEAAFAKQVTADAARGRTQSGDAGLFVHGYNYSFQESLFRVAQLEADADLGNALVLFAWPSLGATTGYVADREAVTYSRDGLAHVIEVLASARKSKGVTLAGHSMGGWLTMEALRQLRLQGRDDALAKVNNVVLAAPDIDIDVFRQQLKVVGRLPSPITLLVAKDDKALSLSRVLAGDRDRVGAADIDDPRVQQAVAVERLRIIDISQLKSANGSDHDRYTSIAAMFPRLQAQLDHRSGSAAADVGTFVLDGVAATISSPFRLAGKALGGSRR